MFRDIADREGRLSVNEMHLSPLSPSPTTPPAERFHALDLLRATMMLLGVVLHSASNYTTNPGEAWPFRDGSSWRGFDLLIDVIHLFRMPAFFLMAGFFGALMLERRGAASFAINRLQRVALPLVVGWSVLFPLTVAGFVFAIVNRLAGPQEAFRATLGHLVSGAAFKDVHLAHLWFLHQLLIFYACAILLVAAARTIVAPQTRELFVGWAARLITNPWGVLVLASVTAVTLLPMRQFCIETHTTLAPPLRVLAAYGVFFVVGWCLQYRSEDLADLARGWAWRLALGIVLGLIIPLAAGHHVMHPGPGSVCWFVGMAALATWLLILGSAGVYLRYLNRPLPLARYLADASYWIYLVHLPITIAFAGAFSRTDWPVGVKFGATFLATSTVCVLSYTLFVRSTVLGQFLNGRRQKRWPGVTA
ncbi:MAG: acyltransferase family protein [Deltaproteobacteria bacterium]|nr:acyltransferase family protein [Deltaproteobacteria bacterium]